MKICSGVKYDGNTYVYRKDIQGNIVAIIDCNGNVVVQYKYDAWGNHAVLDAGGSDIEFATHIGNLNPFRYRGYYYDTETGLYYLKSRYYDPEVGRFISIDGISYLDAETVNGLNLYAYCLDNPVMFIDLGGCFAISLTVGLIALFGLLAVGTIEAIYHPIGNFLTWGYNSLSNAFSNINWGSSGSISSDSLTMTQVGGVLTVANGQYGLYVAVGALSGLFLAEHTNNKRPSTKDKHEKGQTQRKREKFGGEKGDKRRPYHKWKRNANFFMLDFLKYIYYIINEVWEE